MMQTTIHLETSVEMGLTDALLIYTAKHSEAAYVTHHDARGGKLGPARPVTQEFVRKLNECLEREVAIEVLPENVIARSNDFVAWWTPAQRRAMFFSGDRVDAAAQLSGKQYPQPALVWAVRRRLLSVRALRASIRPEADTELFFAPYWNVNGQGDVCIGSMPTPSSRSASAIFDWENGFFTSEFSHANNPRLVDWKGGYLDFLANHQKEKFFPASALIPARQTVAQFLKGGTR